MIHNIIVMICPHCLVAFSDNPTHLPVGIDIDGRWNLVTRACPECKRLILHLETDGEVDPSLKNVQIGSPMGGWFGIDDPKTIMIRPKGSSHPPCPTEVPEEIKNDYLKACVVLPDSAEASAALSRRCLQHILHDQGFKSNNLIDEIRLVIKSGKLPSNIAENIDAVRNIGNFAAHPQKSLAAAELLPVEPEEAEWNLDVIESLFDVFYVQPSIAKKKRDALNKKLQQIGKPPMK